MANINEYKLIVQNTLRETRYSLTFNNLAYTFPIVTTNRGPGKLGGVEIALDKPVNNKTFSLSGKTEGGSFEFEAFERFNPQTVDSVYNDRSYDPATGVHTLDKLISELEASAVSGSSDEATKLKNRFQQDSSNNYVVRTVEEQRIWLKEFIHNPGLNCDWTMFGGEYDFRTIDGTGNNTGTPVFVTNADIEPSGNTAGRGTGTLEFNVGGRL